MFSRKEDRVNTDGKRDATMGNGYVEVIRHAKAPGEFKINPKDECSVSFCNILLSRLYYEGFLEFHKQNISKKRLVKMCHDSFGSIGTVSDVVAYEVEELLRTIMNYRYIYLPLESFRLFCEEGLEYYFRNQNFQGICQDSRVDYEVVIKRCLACTLCSVLDRSCIAKVHKDVIKYVLDSCDPRIKGIKPYEFEWIIHPKETLMLPGTGYSGPSATFWSPESEISFYANEPKEVHDRRCNVLNMRINGRAVDNDLQVCDSRTGYPVQRIQKAKKLMRVDGEIPKEMQPLSAEIVKGVSNFDEDKAWITLRNPHIYKQSIGEYMLEAEPDRKRDSKSRERQANWMIHSGHGPFFAC